MHTKLAISIITYERAKHIAEVLFHIAKPASELEINIYIFDGSIKSATENIVKGYIDKGFTNIFYFHNDERDISKSVRQRTTDALTMPDAEYVWMCGDKFLINPSNYELLLYYVTQGYDIITFYDKCFNGTRYFTNPVKFVEYTIVPLTHFGSTIIKKELIMNSNIDIMDLFDEHLGFTHIYIYMKAIEKARFKGVALHIGTQSLLIKSKYNTTSLSANRMWITWIRQWYIFVTHMPETYKSIEECVINKLDKELGFFSFIKLLEQRAMGQFDLKRCIEYKKYVNKVVLMPYIFVCLIASMPCKVAGIIYHIYAGCPSIKMRN